MVQDPKNVPVRLHPFIRWIASIEPIDRVDSTQSYCNISFFFMRFIMRFTFRRISGAKIQDTFRNRDLAKSHRFAPLTIFLDSDSGDRVFLCFMYDSFQFYCHPLRKTSKKKMAGRRV